LKPLYIEVSLMHQFY